MLQRSTVWRCQLPGSMEMQPSLTQATPSAGSVSPSTGGQGGPLGATTCCTGRWWKQARTEVIAICQDGLLSGYWYFPSLFHPISGGTDIVTRKETKRCCEDRLCLFQKIFYGQKHLEDILNKQNEFFVHCCLEHLVIWNPEKGNVMHGTPTQTHLAPCPFLFHITV